MHAQLKLQNLSKFGKIMQSSACKCRKGFFGCFPISVHLFHSNRLSPRGSLSQLRRHGNWLARHASRPPDESQLSILAQNEDDRKPLVVLVGWLGAQERHLNKYSQLWRAIGHPTWEVRPRTSSIAIPPLGDLQAAKFLASLEEQRDLHQKRDLLLHIFSNAGFLFIGTALRHIANNSNSTEPTSRAGIRNVPPQSSWLCEAAGTLFDSAPARLTADIAARGFVAAGLGEPALDIEREHRQLVKVAAMLFSPILESRYVTARLDEIWAAWCTSAPTSPQIYLFSDADALIPPAEVLHFKQLQAARGVKTFGKTWTDSPHCEHFRRYPEEYKNELQQFVATCRSKIHPRML